MPKSWENDDGSDSGGLEICNNGGIYIWPRLADPRSMKRKVRPLFSLLLLLVFGATFLSRAVFRRTLIGSLELEALASVRARPPPAPPVLNQTLLRFAAIDLGEEKAKREIGQLLDGDFGSLGRYKTFATWRHFHHRDIRARTSNGVSELLHSPNFYRHWVAFRRILHDWSRKKRHQPEIMSELVKLVKNPVDRSVGAARYSSCAVVGNSGILLNREFGAAIDGHEAVIRLNNARTESYERRVGSKTTISFVNSNILHLCARRENCFCHPYGENVPIVMYICQAMHFFDYTVCNSSYKAPLIVTDPRFDELTARIVKYYSLKLFVEKQGKAVEDWGSEHDGVFFHYSSGMQAVMLALGICDKVGIFGFGKLESAKHHYHTNQKAELHLHDYEAEYEFYRDLVERPGAIPFVPRSFKIPPVIVYQ